MGKNDLLLYVVVGGAAAYWYFKMNGKATVDSILGELKGGLGGGGDIPTVEGINGQVQDMLNKTGSWTDSKGNNFNNQSGQDTQINRQSNTGKGGTITQKQSHSQKSTVFFTMPRRLGNL